MLGAVSGAAVGSVVEKSDVAAVVASVREKSGVVEFPAEESLVAGRI